ncbi:hypothetical protein KL86DPRO_10368 [uncultured delta proteobacterium]|uniref:Helix-turn-helix domain-containing protein n=1 Tax=uncultured delta proteobacterium TaxID=34034 RepID=A0A212IZ76_9DELT|nr:hypothetical protein KL86DPRO_10368 [uncultured delta proteobacterium]
MTTESKPKVRPLNTRRVPASEEAKQFCTYVCARVEGYENAYGLRHPTTIRALIKEGSFPARKVGVGWRIEPEAVKRWLSEKQPSGEDEE